MRLRIVLTAAFALAVLVAIPASASGASDPQRIRMAAEMAFRLSDDAARVAQQIERDIDRIDQEKDAAWASFGFSVEAGMLLGGGGQALITAGTNINVDTGSQAWASLAELSDKAKEEAAEARDMKRAFADAMTQWATSDKA